MSIRCSECFDYSVYFDEASDVKVNNSEDNPPLLTLLDIRETSDYFICPACKSPIDKINIRFCHICGWEEYLL